MLVSLSRSSFDFMSGIFDSSSQIFNMPMFLIFLFRRLGVDGCASQPPSRLLLCLGFAVCYATFCLVLFSALACT